MSRPQRDTICAVIVTLNPDDDLAERAADLLQQTGGVVVVDNGSDRAAVEMLNDLTSRPGIHLILNHDNAGIATALNQGVGRAGELGFDWVLLFDQDSDPEATMVSSLAAIYDGFPDRENLAIIGSNYYSRDPGHPEYAFSQAKGDLWIERKTVITSGSLIPLKVYAEVGPFRDGFFIDHVDDEYSFRARSLGYNVIMSRSPLMRHAIGVREEHRVFFHTVETSNHSPERRYYMSRNVILMAGEYLFTEPGWVFGKCWKLVKSVFLIALFERNRTAKLRHLLKGVWHGVRRKLGRLEDLT